MKKYKNTFLKEEIDKYWKTNPYTDTNSYHIFDHMMKDLFWGLHFSKKSKIFIGVCKNEKKRNISKNTKTI